MSGDRVTRAEGAFSPGDLEVMARALARMVNVKADDQQREIAAAHLIGWYQSGVSDEDELVRLATASLARKSM